VPQLEEPVVGPTDPVRPPAEIRFALQPVEQVFALAEEARALVDGLFVSLAGDLVGDLSHRIWATDRLRDLLKEVEGVLQASLHAGVDDRVAGDPARRSSTTASTSRRRQSLPNGVAVAKLDGETPIVSGGDDGTVRLPDPRKGSRPLFTIPPRSTVKQVKAGAGGLIEVGLVRGLIRLSLAPRSDLQLPA
jgi:hypothetical protein